MVRISNLSDDLLLKIVSSLPTKNVAATMLLSKRWRFLWTMLPKLHFNNNHDYGSDSELQHSEYEKFVKYVDRSLVLNRAPVLETLKFKVCPCCSSEDLATWIRIGMVREVRELEISDWSEEPFIHGRSSIVLPRSLYTYAKLEVLKLADVVVLDVPTDVFFPSLKSLHLQCVEYGSGTDGSYRTLLSGCPVLEELVLDACDNFGLPPLSVDMHTLQRLSILGKFYPGNGKRLYYTVVFNVPSLKYLKFVDCYGDLCLSRNMPEVVEANVCVTHQNREKLLESLTSVKRLCLCLAAPMLQHRIGFYHLLHLELCGGYAGWWDLLTWMLESSPKLQLLKLCTCNQHVGAEPIEGHWREPSSVPECLMFHLHTFNWKPYNLEDEEKKIVAYILKNARELKTAGISMWTMDYSKILQAQKFLVSLPRASSSCQLKLNGVVRTKSRSIASKD
ncbi:unnamed protein product [Microthlaspi erraticum]|uniref:FBD domain-containing protein n=1 Tax=Microthlaspi erraticum TaxID=1685480 RepID=A0A6D2ILW3_9BRAS|nr:unnamed protein product [Microthlaspi erraticum]